ncbi:protein-methionine-sulfoxide reductase catalytic subunit MsrP [Sulfurimonas sp. HSL-3221]|uniref:protein-methionine-sulfoxide reductase catalytic subunit MsrP n=1 Tax=Thiomicrolovo sulfuroxydans TaxID=2894755 RepID=UPI001E3451DE|nr:protein-methionine-sulfoxide reductase catalytic subunit MsrP [Sulfurimonas sp. HSL-3221]UFS61577.1 protein-methionine-sulfoxide reductase catalytic subunit MsrP [Sulfurimonas sp. HSL-3221]
MQRTRYENRPLREADVTDEALFDERRKFLKLGAATLVSTAAVLELAAKEQLPAANLDYAKDPNAGGLELNTYEQITSYNNFYEFTTSKEGVKPLSKHFKSAPWKLTIDGMVEQPLELDVWKLMKQMPLEERIYRFRCVEGWSMVVPWIGFELSRLIAIARPLASAKYVRFETLYDPEQFPDQDRGLLATLDYPYVEGLRMDEAMHPLTLMAVGLYGHTLPPQNGAPIRLVVPWKYGFKSIKSVVRITFTDTQPRNTWNVYAPHEFGFYANVNPDVDHPRWSQARERVLGHFFKQPTLMFNGYGKEVAHLYKGMDLRKQF